MSLNETPLAQRVHIAFFGCRNAGKSSLVNAVTNQQMSVVSSVGGTTTDPVKKTMELLPIGPVAIIDTPGFDDSGALGEKRVEAARKILSSCDIAVLVTDSTKGENGCEKQLLDIFSQRGIPYLIAKNKCDLLDFVPADEEKIVYVSAAEGRGINNLKQALASLYRPEKEKHIAGDLIAPGSVAVLVTPIDSAAPRGRLILPQQQTVRDIIDCGSSALVTRETELEKTLASLKEPPAIVITDSQAFKYVANIVPQSVPLTSFSILMARYKGFLAAAVKGARAIDSLRTGSKVLISEGCTHHRQCGDIGTVKLPALLKKRTGAELELSFTSGGDFPQRLSDYSLIIHCGGCMLNEREMRSRMALAASQNVPFTNYGTAIAYMNGILERSVAPLAEISL